MQAGATAEAFSRAASPATPAGPAAPASPGKFAPREAPGLPRGESEFWLSDTYSDAPTEVTLRQNIAMLGRMREEPMVAQIRRQRQATRAWGSLGGWLCVAGTALCLGQGTPDSAGFAALAAGAGCTVGGIFLGVDTMVHTLCRDSPQRAARRHDQQLLLRTISNQLPLDGTCPRGRQKIFQAVVEATHRLCDTLAMDAHELSREVAQEAPRGCLLALLAGFAAACLMPLVGQTSAIIIALTAGGLPLCAAIARMLGCGGSWQRLRALAARPYGPAQGSLHFRVNPDMVLPVQLPSGELERLFGPPAAASRPPITPSEGLSSSGSLGRDVEQAGA